MLVQSDQISIHAMPVQYLTLEDFEGVVTQEIIQQYG
jgi:hypothetical protein